MMASLSAPIAIGVTGHRPGRLAGIDLPILAKQLTGILAAIEAGAPGVNFRLIGSLAEGADMMVADAALDRGWRVDAVLPFPRSEYSADFISTSAGGAFNRHLAAVGSAFELPGRRDEPGGEGAAYERAGRIVLAQSDLLLAVWDGDPPAGRGGAAQMVAEAVLQGLPVLVVDPANARPAVLLWSGLNEHVFGPEALDTVARADISALPKLLAALNSEEEPALETAGSKVVRGLLTRPLALAYPLLLALTGVRGLRRTDLFGFEAAAPSPVTPQTDVAGRIAANLSPRFQLADQEAAAAAQMFRGAFVSNFALAALAVTLSLAGFAAAPGLKPVLALGEFTSIAAILLITHAGSRSGWHERWLRYRRIAERLRCLGLSALLGDLILREDGVFAGEERQVARSLGLPSGVADAAYLADVHQRLLGLLNDQIGYLERDAAQMHRLEHRLHRFGGLLFITVGIACVIVFAIELSATVLPHGGGAHHPPTWVALLSAALPAIGAAIYGIRMQGDFAGTAQRNSALSAQLRGIRKVATDDPPTFDALLRLVRHTMQLLGQDLGQWFRSSRARPLALPG